MSRIDIDGEWETCTHCGGTGMQHGFGEYEECCHCFGRGEVWLDDVDLEDDEMNYHPCETPGCKRSTYHPNRPLCLECESAKIDAEREMIETEKSLKAGGICSECGVDDLFEDEE